MAISRAANVIFCDTDATTYTGTHRIVGIKYIGNTSGTLSILDATSSGKTLWTESGASNVYNQVDIYANDGLYVTLTNGAKVYIYLEA
jgi:hypothetical protein